jgi:hypothetical protein
MSLSRAVAHKEGEPDCRHLAQKHPTTHSNRSFPPHPADFAEQLFDPQQTFIAFKREIERLSAQALVMAVQKGDLGA